VSTVLSLAHKQITRTHKHAVYQNSGSLAHAGNFINIDRFCKFFHHCKDCQLSVKLT